MIGGSIHSQEYESAQILRRRVAVSSLDAPLTRLVGHVIAPGVGAKLQGAAAHDSEADSALLPAHNADEVEGRNVNACQRDAVRAIAPGLSLIHGPPGTGKSTTILHIIASRTPRHSKVLVTCKSNQAINSVAEKVSAPAQASFSFPIEAQ